MTPHSMKGFELLNKIPKSLNKTVWCARGNMLLCRDIQLNAFTLNMVSNTIYIYICLYVINSCLSLPSWICFTFFLIPLLLYISTVSSKAWNMFPFDKMCHNLSRRWTLQSFSDATASIYHNYSLDIRYAIHLATTATSPRRWISQ